jgi:hypothetical protein
VRACEKCGTELEANALVPYETHGGPLHTTDRCFTVKLEAAMARIVTMGKEGDECDQRYLDEKRALMEQLAKVTAQRDEARALLRDAEAENIAQGDARVAERARAERYREALVYVTIRTLQPPEEQVEYLIGVAKKALAADSPEVKK